MMTSRHHIAMLDSLAGNAEPGFRVGLGGQGTSELRHPLDPLSRFRRGWLEANESGAPDADRSQLAYATGGGGGGGTERCHLMPDIQNFGFCLYLCPNGTVKRLDKSRLGTGCQPWIHSHDGLGL